MTTNSAGLSPRECVRLLIEYRNRWLLPTMACAVVALGYSLMMSRYWKASQALVVRNEVSVNTQGKPGEFSDVYEMRTAQETILELAKSRQVLAATLQAVNSSTGATAEPTLKQINKLRKHLSLQPPYGAEFGKTEVFYLSIEDKSPERSAKLVEELCRQLDKRMRNLRDEQAQSIITELEMQVQLAERAHQLETANLELLEADMGSDLGELRMLHSAFSGQSDLRQQVVVLESEHRRLESEVREAEQLLEVLQTAQQSPESLVAMPSSLLDSQPTLRSLKEGLVAAQLSAARLTGTRTDQHPQTLAATKAVERIQSDLHRELQVAIQGVEIELALNRDHAAAIGKQLTDMQQRLSTLAKNRAEYTNRVAAVENSRDVLAQARKQLSEIQAVQVAAQQTSLVTPIDRAEVGEYPEGISRAAVVMVGTMGGLILGLGCVFVTVPPTPQYDEAWNNQNADHQRTAENYGNDSYSSQVPATVSTASTSTIVDAYDSSQSLHEAIDERLAAAEDLTTA